MNILFNETQKERGSINNNFLTLAELLESEGHKIRVYNSYPIKFSSISESDAFVLLCPDGSKLYGHEVKALLRFVDEGGSLLIFANAGGDKGLNTNLNSLLKHFEIEIVANQIFDHQNFDLELESNVVISKLFDLPYSKDVNSITIVSSCSLSIGKNVTEIARTESTSDPPSATIMATTSYGLGTVIVCGSYLMFSDRKAGIELRDNKQLILNIFENISESPLAAITEEEEEEEVIEEVVEEEPIEDVEEQIIEPFSKVDMVKEALQKEQTDTVKEEVMRAMNMLKEEIKPKTAEPLPRMKKDDIYQAIAIIENLEKEIAALNIEDPGYRDILITDMARREGIDYTQVLPYLEKMREKEKKKKAEGRKPTAEIDIENVPTPPVDEFARDIVWGDDQTLEEDIQEIKEKTQLPVPAGETNLSDLVSSIKELKNSVDVLSANLIHLLSEMLIELKEQRKRKR
ncbi:MAG: hypothetical protein ACXABK_02940 [Candidatus Heimdallarchaeaceae archaeon]